MDNINYSILQILVKLSGKFSNDKLSHSFFTSPFDPFKMCVLKLTSSPSEYFLHTQEYSFVHALNKNKNVKIEIIKSNFFSIVKRDYLDNENDYCFQSI